MDEANEGGSSNELPWSAVFNRAANVRAFSAIQAAGFRAASELVERFVRIASTELDKSGGFAAGAAPASDERGADLFGATGLQPLVSSWWTMADQFLRVSAPRGDEPARATAVTLDFVTSTATGALQLEATAPCTATTEVWLHNGGSTDLGKVRLRCSELLAHDGAVVPADELRFEPDIVPLPARSSRGVTVEVEIGQDVAPGSYRGTLLVDGYPDLWVPIELAITRLGVVTSTAGRADLVAEVEDHLRKVAKVVRRAMLDAIPDGEPVQWLYGPMREYPSRPGKALRPALCLSASRAFGGEPEGVLGIAVAIELLHNAFLVHDDVADGSEMRRGRPTLAATHGMAAALNAGDGLAIVSGQVLRSATRRLDGELADMVWQEFDTMAMRTLEGQAIEVGWQLDNVDLRPEDYLELIMHKTCWYTTIHPLRVGALVGSGGKVDLAPLVRFGFHFGAAFQIRDDLLNLIGDERTYGKEILGDLYEGKRTLTLMHLLSTATGADRALLSDYLRRDRTERSDDMVRTVRRLMDSYGSVDFTREYAEGILLAAEEYFEQAFVDARPGPDLDFLRSLVPYVWARWR